MSNPTSKRERRRRLLASAKFGQRNLCCWCGGEMNDERNHPLSATLEHLIPVADGGRDTLGNTRAAHKMCNNRRGRTPIIKVTKSTAVYQP